MHVSAAAAKLLEKQNEARRELGLSELFYKVRRCIECKESFISVEMRTCVACRKEKSDIGD